MSVYERWRILSGGRRENTMLTIFWSTRFCLLYAIFTNVLLYFKMENQKISYFISLFGIPWLTWLKLIWSMSVPDKWHRNQHIVYLQIAKERKHKKQDDSDPIHDQVRNLSNSTICVFMQVLVKISYLCMRVYFVHSHFNTKHTYHIGPQVYPRGSYVITHVRPWSVSPLVRPSVVRL